MGKYDDAIGGGKITLDVEEVLNEESAKKVDERIKKQKAELEKPAEIEIKTDRAVKRLEELTKAAKQVKSDLQEALSSKKSFEDINKLVSKYELLKKNIKSLTPNIDKNNASLKESNKVLKDTKKLIDQLSVSQEKLNKTKNTKSIDSTVKQVDASKDLVNSTEQAISVQEKQTKTIKEQVKATEELAAAQKKVQDLSKSNSNPTGAKSLDSSEAQQKLNTKINELKQLISNQEAWLKYLDRVLNSDNFKTSGKRDATVQLKSLTQSLVSQRSNNYKDASNQYAKEMAEVAWVQGYKEAQKQGVAESTLTRYSTDAKFSYENNLKTLQKEYEYRQKILNESQSELNLLQLKLNATQELSKSIEQTAVEQEKSSNGISNAIKKEEQLKASVESTTAAIKEQNKVIQDGAAGAISKSSSSSDIKTSQLLKDTNLNALLKELNVNKEDYASIQRQFEEYANALLKLRQAEINNSSDYSDIENRINDLFTQLGQSIYSSGSIVIEQDKIYEEFYQFMKGIRIGYTDDYKKEFGDDWNGIINRFRKVLTKDTGKPGVLMPDELYVELADLFPALMDKNAKNEKDQLNNILSVLQKARDEHANKSKTTSLPLFDDMLDDIYVRLSTEYLTITRNAEDICSKIKSAVDQEQLLAQEAQSASKAIESQATAASKTAKALKDVSSVDVSVEELISRDINEALAQLRSAKDNETSLISLKGVFNGDDLVDQFRSMVEKIAEQANLSVGNINVKDDVAKVRLYNDELKVTVEQTYQLRQATEETEASLELISQTFNQNVKALSENKFDTEGIQQRALAAVEKVRSSLHGLEYDLTGLENAAMNISSKEDFTKFNNQLKAAQDNIQAIKNATVSKSSMNQLANMQRDMKNANIELETMRIKLQKIGDIDGVEDAKKMIDDMAVAAQKFNAAQDAQGQQDAYSAYSSSRSSFKAQLEYLNAVKSFNASQTSASKQTINPIKEQYQSILDTVNKINSINSDILKFQKQDAGSGLYSGYIKQLQAGKEQLIAQLQSTIQEINNSLSAGFIQGKEISVPSIKFLDDNGAVSSFLNDTKTQAILTTEEIDKLVASLQKAQSVDVQAAAKVAEQFRSVQETYKQITSLSSLDTNGSRYKGVENVFAQIMQYKESLSSDPTQWTPEQSQNLQTLINKFNEYGNVLVQVGQKEAQYFAGKQKYTVDTSMQTMAKDAKNAADEVNTVQQKLTTAAQKFAQQSGASGAIITNFVQGADGIAKLDFSVLEDGTNKLHNFSIEMGSVTDGMYLTETTAQKSMSSIQSAKNQMSSMLDLLNKLQASGINMDQSGILQFTKSVKDLNVELSKPAPNETEVSRLAKEAKISQVEVEKLYKKHLQLRDAIERGDAQDLGNIDFNGNVYNQLTEKINAFAEVMGGTDVKIGKFNERTGQLKFTMNATDGTVKEFTVSLDRLGKSAAAQETSVKDLGTKWDQFKNSISKIGKQFLTAYAGANVFYKVLSEIRKGINYVKEIDLAMTELKKVTDETEESYDRFLETASKTAGTIGSTVSDFTDATANFARLGYSIEDSADMAKTAIVYKNVADGLDTVEESTNSIISTMKAFGIESDDTMGIIDRFNEVGNNFAITSAGIGEALQRSASALYEAGNTIDESIGLVTAANSVWNFLAEYKLL